MNKTGTEKKDDSAVLLQETKDEKEHYFSYRVIKDTLPDHFSGFINIADEEGRADSQFSIVDRFVTMIPFTDSSKKELGKLGYNACDESIHHRWFYGYTDLNSAFAFLQTTPVRERLSSGLSLRAGYLHTPVIVHGSDSSITDVHTFNSIEFYGGIIDKLYNSAYAIEYSPEQKSIVFKDLKKYLHSFDVTINNEKFRVKLLIRASYVMSIEVPDLKNNVCSSLRFEFDDDKTLDDIGKYYNYALRLFQFCSGRLNVRSNICIFNSRISEKPIYVRMQDEYEDYANDVLLSRQVIGLDCLLSKLPELISVLNEKKIKPYIEFLPLANKFAGLVNYTQITDLCVSFENEYKFLDNAKDPSIVKEAEKLTEDLLNCIDNSNASELVKNKAKGIITGNLQNFSPSLKEKIGYIYGLFKDDMRTITEQDGHDIIGVTKFYKEKEFKKKIKLFSQIRGSAAHSGVHWNGGEEIYLHLVLLIYYSILSRAGYSNQECTRILSCLFYHRF